MKRILYILCAVIATALASCNQEETNGNDSSATRQVTIEATADYAMADGSAAPQTRGTATADRYVIEVYQQADYTQAANVFADGTNRATNATGAFAMTLEKGKSYYCLLWADKQANGTAVYTVTDLKNVSLVAGSTPSEAFHGTKTIEGDASTYSVSLTRAVANIVLKETGTLAAGTLNMKFSQPTAFDVSTAAPTGTPADRTETLAVSAATGTKDAPVTISTAPILVFAPAASVATMNFTFQYGAQVEFEVNNASVQANYNTNITGQYGSGDTPVADYIEVNGLKVAVGNLVADGANGCKIGAPTDGGLYFQFGSLVGWSSTGDATIAVKPVGCTVASWDYDWTGASDPSADPDANDEVAGEGDPCRYYLGGTWRLPTDAEFGKLFENDGYPSSGPWKAEGDFSAGSSSYAAHTSGLKIPASGCRGNVDGSLSSVGSGGNYWSASPYDSVDGCLLYFFSSFVLPSGSTNRAYGFAVRCVRSN